MELLIVFAQQKT